MGRRLDRLATSLEMRNTDPRLHSTPRLLSSTQGPPDIYTSISQSAALRCLQRRAWLTARRRIHAPTLECPRRRNLLVDVNGGPNHLKNLCDANMIQDAAGEKGGQPLIKQASRSLRAGVIDESRNHCAAGRAGVLLLHGPLLALPRPGRQAGSGLKHSRGRDPAGGRRRHQKRRVAPPACSLPRSSFKTELERRAPTPPPPPRPGARRRVTVRSGGRARLGQSGAVSGNLGPSRAIWAHLGPSRARGERDKGSAAQERRCSSSRATRTARCSSSASPRPSPATRLRPR